MKYWVACDEAYPLVGALLSPYPGTCQGRPYDDSFNYYLSSYRVVIENAFGVFVQRWGILWRRLLIDLEFVPKVLMGLAILHNFIIDEDDDVAYTLLEGSGGQRNVFLNDCNVTSRNVSNSTAVELRGYLTCILQDLHILRP